MCALKRVHRERIKMRELRKRGNPNVKLKEGRKLWWKGFSGSGRSDVNC